jgi:hypothetical protein
MVPANVITYSLRLLTVGYDQINPRNGTTEELFQSVGSCLNLLLDAMNERNVSHILSAVKLAILWLFNIVNYIYNNGNKLTKGFGRD